MAQLTKIEDLVSRYQLNLYHYSSQFIRLKRKGWNRFKVIQGEGDLRSQEDMLKKQFLAKLLPHQIVWASTTIKEKSYPDPSLYNDKDLAYFLQQFPDSFLILYKPVFIVKAAPVDVDIIIISPTETYCITLLNEKPGALYIGSDQRFWTMRTDGEEEKVINPLIALKRMEHIVKDIYQSNRIDFPIRKIILSKEGKIHFHEVPYGIECVDRLNHDSWHQTIKRNPSPIKHKQLKACQALLNQCKTTAVKRLV